MASVWRALQAQGADIRVIVENTSLDHTHTDFADQVDGTYMESLSSDSIRTYSDVAKIAAGFNPDTIIVAGWWNRAYLRLVASSKVATVLAFDNPKTGSLRQTMGSAVARLSRNTLHCALVPGERAATLATSLGFTREQLVKGLYGIDYISFNQAARARSAIWPRAFVYVGTLEVRKGVHELALAYQRYRSQVAEPWPLTVIGSGPLQPVLGTIDGVHLAGFLSPSDVPALLQGQGGIVLPSHYDPWPIVLLEAAAAGLPIIASSDCGSAVELVREYFNGLLVPSRDVDALASGLRFFHDSYERLPQWGAASEGMASAYTAPATAERWLKAADVAQRFRRRLQFERNPALEAANASANSD